MKLKDCFISESSFKEYVRLSGVVQYIDGQEEIYWYDLPKEYEKHLTLDGNVWLACLLPLAVTLNEPLIIPKVVDSKLLENARKLMMIWKYWYPYLNVIPIEAEYGHLTSIGNKRAAFFSGGVDAFFTVLQNEKKGSPIDELIFVGGFDIPIDRPDEISAKQNSLSIASEALKKKLVTIRTNIKQTRFNRTMWGNHSHNCAIASVGLLLESRYNKVHIASTGGLQDLRPWGSHVLTDPLFSTNSIEFICDGAEFNRTQKTVFIADSDVVLDTLHVCWKDQSDRNCSQCMKCFRTMIILDLLNVLNHCSTFDITKYDPKKIPHILIQQKYDYGHMTEIKNLAQKLCRDEVVKYVTRSIQTSRFRNFIYKCIRWFNRRVNRVPLLGQLAVALERSFVANTIL